MVEWLAAGEEVLWDSFVLKRVRFGRVGDSVLRFTVEGELYECACGSTADCGVGECRDKRFGLRVAFGDVFRYDRAVDLETSSLDMRDGAEEMVGCAVCG